MFGAVPAGLRDHVGRLREELNEAAPPLCCLLRRTDVQNYMPGAVLPKVDRMSMRHSLEVRTPFLSVELARFAEHLPERLLYANKRGKVLLRELAYRHLPRKLIDLPKQGFGIPMSRWGRDELLGAASRLLETEESALGRALGPSAVGRFMVRQRSKNGFSTYQVWALAMLESWLRSHPTKLEAARAGEARVAQVIRCPTETTLTEGLWAWPVAPAVFVVLEDPAIALDMSSEPRPESGEAARSIMGKVLQMIVHASQRSLAPVESANLECGPLRLQAWGEYFRDVAGSVRDRLQGSTLLFPQTNVSRSVGAHDVYGLQAMGVSKLVFFHPFRHDGAVVSLTFRPTSWLKRLVCAALLQPFAKAWIGQSFPQLSLLGIHRFWRDSAQRLDAGPIRGIDAPEGTEASGCYALFEGLIQLPPLPVSHADIAEFGGGRYSVWNRRCVFSSTSPWRAASRPFWMVRRSRLTAPLLQMVSETSGGLSDKASASFVQRLRPLFTEDRSTAAEIGVRRGDLIVVMTHGLPPGGAERQWCYLATGLQRMGFHVVLVITGSLEGANGHYIPLLRQNGVPVIQLSQQSVMDVIRYLPKDATGLSVVGPGGTPFHGNVGLLVALLNRLKPKAVFAQLDWPNLLAAIAGTLAHVPRIVLSFRNYNPSHFSYLSNDWLQPCYRLVTKSSRIVLTGNSRQANEDYAKWISIPPERVEWIPNAIDPEDFPTPDESVLSALRYSLGLGEKDDVILGVFRLSEEKAPMLFLEVSSRVLREVPNAVVLIAGEGSMRQAVAERIADLGLTAKVRLLGRRSDVLALMSMASVVLLCSTREGMSNVLMEAQLLGTPVVATRVGGTPDCVLDGESGLLAESGDAEGLAVACSAVLRDRGLAARLGAAGAARMRSFFSKEMMAEQYLSLLLPPRSEPALDLPRKKQSPHSHRVVRMADWRQPVLPRPNDRLRV